MPCAYGRTNNGLEKNGDRRNRSSFKKSVDHYKDHQVAELALRQCEQRWYIYTLICLQPNGCHESAPLLPQLQGVDQSNHFASETTTHMDSLESLSPPAAVVSKVDVPNENADSAKVILLCGPTPATFMSDKNKLAKPLMGPSNNHLPRYVVTGNSSPLVNDNMNSIDSDFLDHVVPKRGKSSKRNSRKKGKKKGGKQYKRIASKKISNELDAQCNKNVDSSNVYETTSPSITGDQVLENDISDQATPPSLSSIDSTIGKDDSENFTDCPRSLMSCTSYSDEMGDSEATISPQRCVHEGVICNYASGFSSMTGAEEIVLSTSNEINKGTRNEEEGGLHDHPLIVDSSVDSWNDDFSEICYSDIETGLALKEQGRSNSSEGKDISCSGQVDTLSVATSSVLCEVNTESLSTCCSSNFCFPNEGLVVCNNFDRSECSSQTCTNNDFHPVVSGKRGRRSRKLAYNGSSNVAERFTAATAQGRTGKDNIRSMWQKVQKSNAHELAKPISSNFDGISPRAFDSSKVMTAKTKPDIIVKPKERSGRKSAYPSSGETFEKGLPKVSSKGSQSAEPYKSTIGKYTKKSKSTSNSEFKQLNQCSRREPCADRGEMDGAVIHHVAQKDGLQTLQVANDKRNISSVLGPASNFCSPEILTNRTGMIDRFQLDSEQGIPILAENAFPPNNIDYTTSICVKSMASSFGDIVKLQKELDLPNQMANKINSDSNDTVCSTDIHEDISISSTEDDSCTKLETKSSSAEFSNSRNSSGMQMWVPVGRRDLVASDVCHLTSLRMEVSSKELPDRLGSRNTEADVLDSDHHSVVSSTENGLCSRPSSGGTESLSFESVESASSLGSHCSSAEESHIPTKCQIDEVKGQEHSFDADLEKITCAVHDAYRSQVAVSVRSTSDSEVPNVEKFIYSASPVIKLTSHSIGCKTCLQGQSIEHSLPLHQIPNISLKKFWQWYEEPGCFGLKVRAQDSKVWGNGSSEYDAYFVPYLSAVQLFGKSRSCSRYHSPSEARAVSFEFNKVSGTFSSSVDECSDQTVKSNAGSDGELMFEYFESEQPPRRRPLFEKIEELVRGPKLTNGRVYGDPSKLVSMNLHDLHPASWYCVAWYPIYRIPYGNFRASFLTYHSLGCFIPQRVPSNHSYSVASIVSPVVGLQAYNDKGESWFQSIDKSSEFGKSGVVYFNSSELMTERMRILKQTAMVMATTVVSKGHQKSMNRHPDYEFFLSRGR